MKGFKIQNVQENTIPECCKHTWEPVPQLNIHVLKYKVLIIWVWKTFSSEYPKWGFTARPSRSALAVVPAGVGAAQDSSTHVNLKSSSSFFFSLNFLQLRFSAPPVSRRLLTPFLKRLEGRVRVQIQALHCAAIRNLHSPLDVCFNDTRLHKNLSFYLQSQKNRLLHQSSYKIAYIVYKALF